MVTFPNYQFGNILSRKMKKKIRGYNKNLDVCKKLELNILKIDKAIAILSLKKAFPKILNF